MPPTSAAGGNCAEGNCLPIASLCGPGSLRFPGPLALIAPCGGWSGLPKEAARAALAVTTAPAADTASISRLENMSPLLSKSEYLREISSRPLRTIKFAFRMSCGLKGMSLWRGERQFGGILPAFKSEADVRFG